MECTVSWSAAPGTRSAMGFVAETGSGHTIAMDGAPDAAKPELGIGAPERQAKPASFRPTIGLLLP